MSANITIILGDFRHFPGVPAGMVDKMRLISAKRHIFASNLSANCSYRPAIAAILPEESLIEYIIQAQNPDLYLYTRLTSAGLREVLEKKIYKTVSSAHTFFRLMDFRYIEYDQLLRQLSRFNRTKNQQIRGKIAEVCRQLNQDMAGYELCRLLVGTYRENRGTHQEIMRLIADHFDAANFAFLRQNLQILS